jgi:hypothetical protein
LYFQIYICERPGPVPGLSHFIVLCASLAKAQYPAAFPQTRSAKSWGMPALIRRHSDNPHQVTWHVYFGERACGHDRRARGCPVDVDQWRWSCGFYPGLHPGQHRYGTGATFDEARASFEADWKTLLPEKPEDAFEEYRHNREARTEMCAKRARGEKSPSDVSIMRCICGVQLDNWKPDESYDHRGPHAAEQQGIH